MPPLPPKLGENFSGRSSGGSEADSVGSRDGITRTKSYHDQTSHTPFYRILASFLFETTMSSILVSIIPICAILSMVQFMKTRAEMVYPLNPDDDELVVPVVFAANYTGHPELDLAGKYTFAPVYAFKTHSYFMESFSSFPISGSTWSTLPYFFGVMWPPAIRAMLLFRAQKHTIMLICTLNVCAIALGTMAINRHYALYQKLGRTGDDTIFWSTICVVFLYIPSIAVLAFHMRKPRKGEKRRYVHTFFLFLGFNLWEVFLGMLYQEVLISAFFQAETPIIGKMIIRGVVHCMLFFMTIELSWQASIFSVTKLGVDLHDSRIFFAHSVVFFPLVARLMQGSTDSAAASVLYEIVGTVSEIVTAEALMKGNTPVRDSIIMLRNVKGTMRNLRMTASATIAGEAVEAAKEKDYAVSDRAKVYEAAANMRRNTDGIMTSEQIVAERANARHSFCVGAMLMISLGEAASIIVSCFFWLFMGVNPATPGARPLSTNTVMINTLIMVIGEIFVTDGIVAYASNKMTKYKMDVAKDWVYEKAKRRTYLLVLFLSASFTPLVFLSDMPLEFCFTSDLRADPTGKDWSLSSCPAFPLAVAEVEVAGVGEEFWGLLEAEGLLETDGGGTGDTGDTLGD